jgi:hypothetical protein
VEQPLAPGRVDLAAALSEVLELELAQLDGITGLPPGDADLVTLADLHRSTFVAAPATE